MDKFKLIVNENFTGKIKRRDKLITIEELKNITDQGVEIIKFNSTDSIATIEFKMDSIEIEFELEEVMNTIIIDYNAEEFDDEERFTISKLNEKIIEIMRFTHKNKLFSLSPYFTNDYESYNERLEQEYMNGLENEIKKINNMSNYEVMDDFDRDFFESEEMDDLSLFITGNDGKKLCEFLLEKKYISSFDTISKNKFEINFKENKDYLKNINKKLIYFRELEKYGYNIWVDYQD